VTPITSVDDIKLGEKYPGPATKRIADYYSEILTSRVGKYSSWLTPLPY